MKTTAAFLFDMDGTMADNMQYHLQAWERAVDEAGSDLKGDALMEQLYGKNAEVIERIFGQGKISDDQVKKISENKEKYYHELYVSHIKLLPGLKDFLTEAQGMGVQLAIATAGLKENVWFIVDHTGTRRLFSAFISDEDVQRSKPDPETFISAAGALDISPEQCIVFEDSPKGIQAARDANMKAVALLTSKQEDAFASFSNVIRTIPDYTGLSVQELLDSLAQAQQDPNQ